MAVLRLKMVLSDATEQQISGAESQCDDRRQILESAIGTVAAIKRFVANFDQVKNERDGFERQLVSALAENERLRNEVDCAQDHYGHFSKSVTTFIDQMETIAARCLEAVKVVRTQIDHRAPMTHEPVTQLGAPATNDQNPEEPTAVPSPPIAAVQLADGRSPDEELRLPNAEAALDGEPSRVIQVFSQYLTQSVHDNRT
jgi:hypothetical protein